MDKLFKDWEINIKKVENGYVLSYYDELSEGSYIKRRVVFEDEEVYTESKPLEGMRNVLNYIQEYFDCGYSKHSNRNLIVEIRNEEE